MALKRKSGFWSAVRDFMADNNGTISAAVPVGDWMPPVVGSCGPPPDVAAMLKEPVNYFDAIADARGWDLETRRVESWIFDKLKTVRRLNWLEAQVNETMKTGLAPWAEMTPEEQTWFTRVVNERQRYRSRRRPTFNLLPT